ncbi:MULTISPECIES: hypothetical protein [unclassified Modestobacter]|uniref:hypothetical protein n=1 Tax=unclassified Modestobacter TaxID=2643866 RepID=UPI0022AA9277|nr:MULTISPECIES: hypothetical protein [unclassified Modestobacter]MCZ2827143.1 hypothetical protein [Modestobacter sp. VKM Ac-2981]MCZ2854394.1 hypothetical protein [Modestobacter sp. VKM Ac-2982]
MRYFVVTHRPLDRPLRPFMEAISTVPAGDDVLDLSAEHPQYAGRGPELSEYATLFALRRHLQASWSESGPPSDDEMCGIAQYRRYPVTRPVGVPSDVYGMVTPAEFGELPDDVFQPAPGTLLLPSVAQVGTVLGQYGRNHAVRDLLHFMGIAIDLGVIDDRAAASFLSQSVMVVAPTIGVYPTRWYVQLLEDLERVADAFESRAAVPREGYQRRATGFCLERLHGMLLAGLVATWPGDRVTQNRAIVVSEDLTYTSGG